MGSEVLCKTLAPGKKGRMISIPWEEVGESCTGHPCPSLSPALCQRVSAAPANAPFQRKADIGAAQPILYTGVYLLVFTTAPRGGILSIRLNPSLEAAR